MICQAERDAPLSGITKSAFLISLPQSRWHLIFYGPAETDSEMETHIKYKPGGPKVDTFVA